MKILFPYEFGPLSDQAENEVLFLSEKLDAEVHLMHAVPKGKGLMRATKLKNERHNIEEAIEKMAAVSKRLSKHHTQKIETIIKPGKVEDTLIEAAKEINADLIIFGTRGGESRLNSFISSPVNYVIQHAPCPCLTIRERPKREVIDDILVVQNPEQPFNLHYQWALKLAKALGTWIRILVIWDPKETDEEDARAYSHHLARYTKEQGITVSDKQIKKKQEKMPEWIIKYADEMGADLIAMMEYDWEDVGSDSQTRTNTWLGGVVNHSKIPVLSARPDMEEAL